jgi:uncharacterized protein
MLQIVGDFVAYTLLRLDAASRIGQSVSYFVYDSIKILALLFLMIAVIGFLRTYLPTEKVRKWLTGARAGSANFVASLFGAVTPFCSCSSIPIFISFMKVGTPLGVAFSFLITSPIINEYLVVIMLASFGWKITLAYVVSGIAIGTIAGILLGRMGLEKHLVKDITDGSRLKEQRFRSIRERVRFGLHEATTIVKKLWLWVLIGVAVGAFIHNYVPEEMIHSLINRGGVFTVPLATMLGVPLYGSCAAIVPIAVALFQKGVPIGTALAFMMAISALSLPEAVILRRAMNLRLILIFFGIVSLAIMLTGYLLNFLQPILV